MEGAILFLEPTGIWVTALTNTGDGPSQVSDKNKALGWMIPGSDSITQSCCYGFGEKCCFSEDCKTLYVPTPCSLIPDRVENVPPWLKCSS
jgi:hypothetical protein